MKPLPFRRAVVTYQNRAANAEEITYLLTPTDSEENALAQAMALVSAEYIGAPEIVNNGSEDGKYYIGVAPDMGTSVFIRLS